MFLLDFSACFVIFEPSQKTSNLQWIKQTDKDTLIETLFQERDELYQELSKLRQSSGGALEHYEAIIREKDNKIKQLNGTVNQLDNKIKDLGDKVINFEDKIKTLKIRSNN